MKLINVLTNCMDLIQEGLNNEEFYSAQASDCTEHFSVLLKKSLDDYIEHINTGYAEEDSPYYRFYAESLRDLFNSTDTADWIPLYEVVKMYKVSLSNNQLSLY